MSTDVDCPFCKIIKGANADVIYRGPRAWVIRPLNPVTEGHLLVISKTHVMDYAERPKVTAEVVKVAARFGPYQSNLITSFGDLATQTVYHLHFHIVPRRRDDGLALPWTSDLP